MAPAPTCVSAEQDLIGLESEVALAALDVPPIAGIYAGVMRAEND